MIDRAAAVRRFAGLLFALAAGRALLSGGLSEVGYAEDWRPPGAVHSVEIDLDKGDLDIQAGPQLHVARQTRGPPGALNLRHEVRDGTLWLSARCRGWLGCEAPHQLQVPPGVRVRARLGEGRATVSGLSALQLQISRGEAEVRGAERAEITVGEGSLRVQSDRPAALDLVVAAGALELQLPPGEWPVDAAGAPLSTEGLRLRPARDGDPSLQARAPGGPARIWAEPPPAASAPAAPGPPW